MSRRLSIGGLVTLEPFMAAITDLGRTLWRGNARKDRRLTFARSPPTRRSGLGRWRCDSAGPADRASLRSVWGSVPSNRRGKGGLPAVRYSAPPLPEAGNRGCLLRVRPPWHAV